MAFWESFRPYVSASARKADAARHATQLRKRGEVTRPVRIDGRQIAKSAWGKAWCDHLESYSDYANRLPRGRTYVRNGSVFHLDIEAGRVRALVSGSSIYEIDVRIRPLGRERWLAIGRDTSGRIDSAIGLLRGRLDAGVMARMIDRKQGLFPAPSEIEMKCSCPDWAGLCKHLAATLYGVGARLDEEPELLFLLRGVDHRELIRAGAAALAAEAAAASPTDEAALGALFGIEIAGDEPAPAVPRPSPGKAPAPPALAPTRATPAKAPPQPAARSRAQAPSPSVKARPVAAPRPAPARAKLAPAASKRAPAASRRPAAASPPSPAAAKRAPGASRPAPVASKSSPSASKRAPRGEGGAAGSTARATKGASSARKTVARLPAARRVSHRGPADTTGLRADIAAAILAALGAKPPRRR